MFLPTVKTVGFHNAKNMIRTQNSNLNIRLTKSLKDNLVAVCKEQNTNYSKLLRGFILEYVNDRQGNSIKGRTE